MRAVLNPDAELTGRPPASLLLFTILLTVAGCGHNPVVTGQPPVPTATALTLTPGATTVDTGATVQLQAAISWSDSAVRAATVDFSATGGTVSDSGLFHAGQVAGAFQVIATCVCGVADTAHITIVAPNDSTPDPPPPLVLGRLDITVTGLPGNAPAQIDVTGPNGFAHLVTTSGTLDSLAPGAYVVRGGTVTVGNAIYLASPDSQSVTLIGGDQQALQITYVTTPSSSLPPHPRVWLDATRVARLQAQVAANTIRWQRVKATADGQVAKGTKYAAGDEIALPDLCAAYLGTGQQSYATRAGVIITGYAVDANNLQGDSGYQYRFELPLVTMGLDWCYDGLTPGERHQAATWLMNRADWVWPETNPTRTGAHGTASPDVNYFWGFMMTGPAALAAMGQDTASNPVSGPDRPAYHLQLALTKWNTIAKPYLDGAGAGGAWVEGTNYDQGWRLGAFADAFVTAGMPLHDPWFAAAFLWHLEYAMPGGVYKVPFGAQTRVSTAPLYTYDREALFHLWASAEPDAQLSAEAMYWLNWIGQVPTSEYSGTSILADELIYYDPSLPSASDLSGLPKSFFGPGAGYFLYRTSWTDPTATVMGFQSGPASGDLLGNNQLVIWKGQFWITSSAEMYSFAGEGIPTTGYNTMTVGTDYQKLGPGQNGGEIVGTPQVSDQLVAVQGQAKMAYGYDQLPWSSVRPVTDYLRRVAYLPQQDAFVVVDRATVKDSTETKVWRWQMKDLPVVNGKDFILQSPSADYRCFGSVLSPATVVLGTQSFAYGSTPGQVSSSAVTVTLPVPKASDIVVTTLQCTAGGSAPYPVSAVVDSSQAVVTVGATTVVVPLDELQPVRLQ
jgi:hypothetical protein